MEKEFENDTNYLDQHFLIDKSIINAFIDASDLKVDENLISCLYFCQNAQVLEQACIYFATDKHQVMQAINYLKLL